MVMEPGAAESFAVWVMHIHAPDAFQHHAATVDHVTAPAMRQTTLLEILYRLVVRPLLAGNISTASVFRVEADTFLPGNDQLRGILNSGNRRGGSVVRTVG
jgi:hypothetical protein